MTQSNIILKMTLHLQSLPITVRYTKSLFRNPYHLKCHFIYNSYKSWCYIQNDQVKKRSFFFQSLSIAVPIAAGTSVSSKKQLYVSSASSSFRLKPEQIFTITFHHPIHNIYRLNPLLELVTGIFYQRPHR